jgi:hypothetical protein
MIYIFSVATKAVSVGLIHPKYNKAGMVKREQTRPHMTQIKRRGLREEDLHIHYPITQLTIDAVRRARKVLMPSAFDRPSRSE